MGTFATFFDRKGTKSVKWDALQQTFQNDDVIPLWIADMDFQAPKEVNDALIERAKHGIYGYTIIDDAVRTPIVNWLNKRHNWQIKKEWLSFSPGVVTSIDMAIRTFTDEQDKILIQTPVYTPFFKTIENQNRKFITNSLTNTNGKYEIDFIDFEEKLKAGVKVFLLCSPHNPVGRVWQEDELRKMAELCVKHNVLILSDEIHCDLIYPGHKHIPIASLSDEIAKKTITFMAPSKTFNLAGLQASYVITKNDTLRRQLDHTFLINGHKQLNTMGVTALEAVYKHGESWLEELLDVLEHNKNYAINELQTHVPEMNVTHPEGTYLLWINCSKLGLSDIELKKFMIQKAKVGLNAGSAYGPGGELFMRINFACHESTLKQGIERIIHAVQQLLNK